MPVNATNYYPYDAGAGANVTEAQWRNMARLWLPNAPIKSIANGLNPFGDSTGLQVKVDTGAAWNYGAYGEWTSGVSILAIASVSGMTGAQERWDRIIQRNDFINNSMQIDVLAGTPQATGAGELAGLPALTQSASKWEIALASVGPLLNTTTTVTAAMVLDRRPDGGISGPGTQKSEKLAEQIIRSSTASFTWSGIVGTYRALEIRYGKVKHSTAESFNWIEGRFNGDSTSGKYANQILQSVGTSSGFAQLLSQNQTHIGVTNGASIGGVGSGRIHIPSYANTDSFKGGHSENSATTNAGGHLDHIGFTWENMNAITSITLFLPSGSFTQGEFELWGHS